MAVLVYCLEQGPTERTVIRQHIKSRIALPDAIAGAPQLRDDLKWVWGAFSDLTTERPPGSMGGAPGCIPWRAMHAYCEAHGLRGDDQVLFIEVLKAMDDAYLEHVCKRLKEKGSGNT